MSTELALAIAEEMLEDNEDYFKVIVPCPYCGEISLQSGAGWTNCMCGGKLYGYSGDGKEAKTARRRKIKALQVYCRKADNRHRKKLRG